MRALVLAPFSDTGLSRLGASVDVTYESWTTSGRIHDPEELGHRLSDGRFSIVVVEGDFLFDDTFALAPQLRLVGICRNALNHVDLEAAASHGVLVTHAPGRNTQAVVELTLGLMLSLLRGIPRANSLIAKGDWRDPIAGSREFIGREIAGSKVGVVGFGRIGRGFAAACASLGATCIVHDPLVPAHEIEAEGSRAVTLDALAATSDIVTLHVPPATRVADEQFLIQMPRHAYLVNTSAGSAVEVDALVAALEQSRIAGAALDVFEGQPLPLSSPLRSAPNLILTPHIGGATIQTVERQSEMMCGEIERFLEGRPLEFAVNSGAIHARGG